MPTPEDRAREHIDQALELADWRVQDSKSANLRARQGSGASKLSTPKRARVCRLSTAWVLKLWNYCNALP